MHTSTEIKYVERFNERALISGFEVEFYQYLDKPVVRGYKRKPRKEKGVVEKKEEKKPEEKKEEARQKTESSVNRTRTEIRRRVNSNPQLRKFLTLTTTETDIGKTNKHFNRFTERMKYRFPEFQYLAVPEFQKDIDYFGKVKPQGGAVHYHLLCNLRFVKQPTVEKIWELGFIKLKKPYRVKNYGRYLCKYLRKDMFDKRLFGKKKFFCSQDLEKPTEIIGESANKFMEYSIEADTLKFIKKYERSDEHRGRVLYQLYNLKNFTF
jgi:hypothetical protein